MTNGMYGGGAEKILQTIISHIDYTKYDVTLYSLHKELIDKRLYKGKFHYRYVFNDNQSFYNKIKGWIFNNCSPRLFNALFIRGEYDVEIAFLEGESTKIVSGSLNKKSKKLAWVHIDLINNPWTEYLYSNNEEESVSYRRFDKVICVSESVKNAFIEKFHIEKEKVHVRYNPVDSENIKRLSKVECELDEKKNLRMIAVGRLVNQKGFDRLLRIANKLKNNGYKFELFIVGDGQEREELENFIANNNLHDQVCLLGFKENPYCYMNASDMIVCSSRAEGFSTVLTEAVILGIPVISTDCAGVRELFGNAMCGRITNNNEEALYDAITAVLKNPECLLEYKKNTLERSNSFSLEKRMMEFYELFK